MFGLPAGVFHGAFGVKALDIQPFSGDRMQGLDAEHADAALGVHAI